MSTTIIPDKDMKAAAISSLGYADSFFATFQKSLCKKESRFDNDLLYNLAVMCIEKYFVALLARYDWNATHHMPVALYNESLPFEPGLTDSMKQTTILVGKFEAICSLDGFGYHTPSTEELKSMSTGINKIKELVEKRIAEI
jgi:hypothetical protein